MKNLNNRACHDYSLMQDFAVERIDHAKILSQQTQAQEIPHAAVKVAKKYKSKDIYKLAQEHLSKDPQQLLLLDQQVRGKKISARQKWLQKQETLKILKNSERAKFNQTQTAETTRAQQLKTKQFERLCC